MKWPSSKATRVRTVGLNMLSALGKARMIFPKKNHTLFKDSYILNISP